jgi:hypothetical protein
MALRTHFNLEPNIIIYHLFAAKVNGKIGGNASVEIISPTTKIRHPELRKRASVSGPVRARFGVNGQSLRVGPKGPCA